MSNMLLEDTLVICFLPSVFNPKSNGHFIYIEFCASLLGEVKNIIFISNDSRYAHGEMGQQSYHRYRERFAGLYMTEQDFATLFTLDLTLKIWMVLPDHIEGLDSILVHFLRNDPHLIGCINVILAPAYTLAGTSKGFIGKEDFKYKEGRDYFAFYSRTYSNNICREEFYIEPLPGDSIPINQQNRKTSFTEASRNLITFYIGKGVVGYSEQVLRVLQNLRTLHGDVRPVLITRAWPKSKREYNEILKCSLCLITYDPITNVERDAVPKVLE